ncbi:hypothetical protein ASC80_11125 [Afipia sp. Root123D2]|uniref:GmrSD restriction endonuclease domain-containing protein n=1 Tax=Afipia sp. Root123D2 TaxID=1736436 RepID=UPI0006F8335C|nr:DUF262 domain-containing protein [Afipia sp. Root123D2]KQW20751.1 hypothetical protein ASC80_11125 [Afipia sp. Root123D2]
MKLNHWEPDLRTISTWIQDGEIDLQPNFQRGDVWPLPKKRKLIDTVLRGWSIPPIHVVVTPSGTLEVLDGQQRLTAIRDFMRDDFPVDGSVEPFDHSIEELHGTRYSNLPLTMRRAFDQYTLRVFRITDSRTMGMGELAAFHLWWALKNLSEKTVLLLEEPESYLSPSCQTAFAIILAQRAVQMKAFVILTTHSPAIIREAGLHNLRFLYRDGRNSLLSNPKRIEALLNGVGIETRTDTILLVEDQAAALFTGLWLAHFDPMVAIGVEVHPLKGASNINKLLEAFPSTASSVRIRGLYDGDQKGQVPRGIEHLAAFLPGDVCLEAMYRKMLAADYDRVGPLLGIADLAAILYSLRQYEDHDWFVKLASAANLTIEQLHLPLFKAWISDQNNLNLAKQAFEALQKILDSNRY